jgi:hypothetical protein
MEKQKGCLLIWKNKLSVMNCVVRRLTVGPTGLKSNQLDLALLYLKSHEVMTGYMSYYECLRDKCVWCQKVQGLVSPDAKTLGPPWGQMSPGVGGWVA